MNATRRTFLASVSTVLFAYILLSHGAFAKMVFELPGIRRRKDFQTRIKDWFYLYNADATHQSNLQLVDIRDEGSNAQVEQFSLVFRSGLMDVTIPTGLYEVAGERFSLFLQHTHEQDTRQFYIAVFSLLR